MTNNNSLLTVLTLSLGLLGSCTSISPASEPPSGRVVLGAFLGDGFTSFPRWGSAAIGEFGERIGKDLGEVLTFQSFEDDFPADDCQAAYDAGAISQVTWELYFPSRQKDNTSLNNYSGMEDVLAGRYDAYIDQWAQDTRLFGKPVMIRFLHEMNGNWYVWGGPKNGGASGGPEKVVAVWRHVVDRFRAQGATNVRWVWCPHGPTGDVPVAAWNDIERYYPGDQYVDWLAFDQYNWYPDDPWGGTRPVIDWESGFQPIYDRLVALAPGKPVTISEFGSGDSWTLNGKDKASWITEVFAGIQASPSIRLVNWFHINKEKDWRVDSSPASLEAFRKAVADPVFGSTQ